MAARLGVERLPVAVARLCHDRFAVAGLGAAVRSLWGDVGCRHDRRRAQCAADAGRLDARSGWLRWAPSSLRFSFRDFSRSHAWTRTMGPPIAVAAVQGAVPQDQKWQAKNLDETMAAIFHAHGTGVGSPADRLAGSLAADTRERNTRLFAATCRRWDARTRPILRSGSSTFSLSSSAISTGSWC